MRLKRQPSKAGEQTNPRRGKNLLYLFNAGKRSRGKSHQTSGTNPPREKKAGLGKEGEKTLLLVRSMGRGCTNRKKERKGLRAICKEGRRKTSNLPAEEKWKRSPSLSPLRRGAVY